MSPVAEGTGAGVRDAEEAVREIFRAFERRDAQALCAVCSEDVVFHAVTGEMAHRDEPYRGHEGMRRYLRDAARVWQEVRPEPERVDVRGEVAVVTGRIYAWGVGRLVDQPAGWTFVVRDGLVVRAEVHETAEAALEAGERLSRTGPRVAPR